MRAAHEELLNTALIANRLALAFGLAEGPAVDGVQELAKKICATFHQDRRVLITLEPCDEFDEATWHWLLHEFWCALLTEFAQCQHRRRVRLLMVLQTDGPLTGDHVVAHCCDTDAQAYDRRKLIRLPLEHWTKAELLDWLADHFPQGRTDHQLDTLAQSIYDASNQGQPSLIYSLCKKRLIREAI